MESVFGTARTQRNNRGGGSAKYMGKYPPRFGEGYSKKMIFQSYVLGFQTRIIHLPQNDRTRITLSKII